MAARLSARPSSSAYPSGLGRAEVLGSLASVAIIWAVCLALLAEAVRRLRAGDSERVQGKTMFFTALFALGVNCVLVTFFHDAMHARPGAEDCNCGLDHSRALTAPGEALAAHVAAEEGRLGDRVNGEVAAGATLGSILRAQQPADSSGGSGSSGVQRPLRPPRRPPSRKKLPSAAPPLVPAQPAPQASMNMRAAYLHILGDLIHTSAVTLVGATLWLEPSWHRLDPLCTFLFVALVVGMSFNITREILETLMHRTPRGLDAKALCADLATTPGVESVTGLRVWTHVTNHPQLSARLECEPGAPRDRVMAAAMAACRRLGVADVTLQLEQMEDASVDLLGV